MGGSSIRNSAFALLVTALAAALLWGCGGGSGGEDSGQKTAASGSKKAFLEEANAICEKGKSRGIAQIRDYLQAHEGSSDSKASSIARALRAELLPQIARQVNEIRALEAPAGDQQQVDAILSAMEEAVAKASNAAKSSPQLGPYFKHSASLARAYGLSDCAYG